MVNFLQSWSSSQSFQLYTFLHFADNLSISFDCNHNRFVFNGLLILEFNIRRQLERIFEYENQQQVCQNGYHKHLHFFILNEIRLSWDLWIWKHFSKPYVHDRDLFLASTSFLFSENHSICLLLKWFQANLGIFR